MRSTAAFKLWRSAEVPATALLTLLGVIIYASRVSGIACYTCNSVNGSNPSCEDPVDGGIMVEKPCMQGISDHKGLFYARFCLKIKGLRRTDGQALTVRRCSMEKLADIPTHCGEFKLNDQLYSGCIATCTKDWCNLAMPTKALSSLSQLLLNIGAAGLLLWLCSTVMTAV